MIRFNSETLIGTVILLVALLVAALIAIRGDNRAPTAVNGDLVPVHVSGAMPERHRASEPSAEVPQPEKPIPADPLPPRPRNWR